MCIVYTYMRKQFEFAQNIHIIRVNIFHAVVHSGANSVYYYCICYLYLTQKIQHSYVHDFHRMTQRMVNSIGGNRI